MRKDLGFTLIEFLIIIGIVGVLAVAGSSSYFRARNRLSLENQIEEIVADLKWTASRSISQESSDQWGIRFSNPSEGGGFYEVWHGESYASGTVVNYTALHNSVRFSDPAPGATKDVVFAKSTGFPLGSSTLELYSAGDNSTGTVDINAQGRIDFTLN